MPESAPESPDDTSTDTDASAAGTDEREATAPVDSADEQEAEESDASVDQQEADPIVDTSDDDNDDQEAGAPSTEADDQAADASQEEVAAPEPPGAFSAIIEAQRLDATIETLHVLVDECRIHLNDDGIRLAAVDPANVAMDETTVSDRAFESFQADGGVLGVNLDRLADIAGMADANDLLHLGLNPATRKLVIQTGGLEYTLALIDPASIRQEPDLPDLDLPARVVLEGADLDRAIRATDMVADHIRFTVDPDEDLFTAHASGDTDDVDLELHRDDLIEFEPGTADSIYSLDYLKDLNKAIPKSAEIELRLGEGFPLMIEYALADGAVTVTQLLAPRVESD